jgi:hypothetical protein
MPRALSPVLAAILNGHPYLALSGHDQFRYLSDEHRQILDHVPGDCGLGAQSIQMNRADRGVRDITRDDLRALVRQGRALTCGSLSQLRASSKRRLSPKTAPTGKRSVRPASRSLAARAILRLSSRVLRRSAACGSSRRRAVNDQTHAPDVGVCYDDVS